MTDRDRHRKTKQKSPAKVHKYSKSKTVQTIGKDVKVCAFAYSKDTHIDSLFHGRRERLLWTETRTEDMGNKWKQRNKTRPTRWENAVVPSMKKTSNRSLLS